MLEDVDIEDADQELKKYCISGTRDDNSVSFITMLTDAQYDFFSNCDQMQFSIGDGIFIAFDRTQLDSFEIQLMQ